jgi:hypothetical protein
LRAKTEYGVYAMWGEASVKSAGKDANGNPRLYFDVGGTKSDVDAFWSDIWKAAESRNASMASILGWEGKKISPARFFLDNLVGANTLFVVVDRSQVDDASMMRDPMFFDMLCSVVPSAVRLFLVERHSSEEDAADMGEADEGEALAAWLGAEDVVEPGPLPGMEGRAPSCGDEVVVRFVRPAPAKVRGRKGEE